MISKDYEPKMSQRNAPKGLVLRSREGSQADISGTKAVLLFSRVLDPLAQVVLEERDVQQTRLVQCGTAYGWDV